MDYNYAVRLLETQDRNIRRINGVRFFRNGYEYRLTYKGGFANYVAIDRRQNGKRNFQYYGGIGAYHCMNAVQAYELVLNEIERREKQA